MDDILVLILTLIFIVAGVFGQMKKKQAPPEPAGEDYSRRQNFWEDMEEEEQKPVGVTEHLQPITEGGRIDRFHTPTQMMRREFIPRSVEPVPEKVQIKKSRYKNFPLKQAVIYSEILNRKYF